MMKEVKSVDEYIRQFDPEVQEKLRQLRELIKTTAPEAKELISYRMPAYKIKKPLVYFAAYKNHIGFYPTGSGIKAFEDKLADYKFSKGAIQFPLNKKLPVTLIKSIVKYKLTEAS